MMVKEVLKRKGTTVVTVGPEEGIWAVLRRFRMHGIGALVVVDDQDRLLGLLTERDLVNGLVARGKHLLDLRVRDAMSTAVPTCRSSDSVGKVMVMMTDQRTRHLPVIDDGELCGIISIGDVVKARLDDVELENKVLRDMARAHQ